MILPASTISSREVGSLSDGRGVDAWTLIGAGGLSLEVLTYGGIVTRLRVPDRLGVLDDVVLGFDKIESYFGSHPYFGAIVGRVAGRMSAAQFNLDGKQYHVAANEGVNHLHGGTEGFDKKIWMAESTISPAGDPTICLSYISPAGEEGYPGTVNVKVTYTVLPDNTLKIQTHAVTDAPTPFSLTHHSYFNLGGQTAGSIADHELQIHADLFSETDDQLIHRGRHLPLEGEPNDFNQLRRLSDAIPVLPRINGDLYLVRKTSSEETNRTPVLAASLIHRGTGRMLQVRTNEDYVQLYTSCHFDGTLTGKSDRTYHRHNGICLECQGHPDGTGRPGLRNIILRPGEGFERTTLYSFSTT